MEGVAATGQAAHGCRYLLAGLIRFDESGEPSQPGLHLVPPQRPSGG